MSKSIDRIVYFSGFVGGFSFLAVLIMLALYLTGCSTSVPAEPSEPPSRITALGACSIIGVSYQAAVANGTLDRDTCAQEACPFPYDSSGRVEVTCDPAAVEQCFWDLQGRANDCEGYREAMLNCMDAAATCGVS